MRVVFDGSSKCEGVSINEMIHTGAVMADIRKMFSQIAVKKEDQDAIRYLWRDDPKGRLEVYRFLRVCFGLNVSPFLSMGTVKFHAERSRLKYQDVSKEIDENMYVDDFPSGRNDVECTRRFAEDSVKIMSEEGFPLVKFVSNEEACLEGLPDGYI